MIANPGERQVGDDFLVPAEVIEQIAVAGRDDQVVEGQHHPLRTTGGSRGIENDGKIRTLAAINARQPSLGGAIRRKLGAAALLDIANPLQAGVVVVAQPARLIVENVGEARQAIRDRGDLVDLLLVFRDRNGDFGVVEHIGHLVGDGVGVDRHRHRAQRLNRAHRPIEPRPIGTDDCNLVAARKAKFGDADRESAHLLEHGIPRPGLPDAEILVPHRGPATQDFCVLYQ